MNQNPWFKKIRIRTPEEGKRQSTWLELFTDLSFVVAIASLTRVFEHEDFRSNLLYYGGFFLAIFWIWNRFTWYATYYDNDDVPFRLTYLAAIFCILGFTASLEEVLAGEYQSAIWWYLGLEGLLLYLWSRVMRSERELRANAITFFYSYGLGTLFIIASLFVSAPGKFWWWIAAFLAELAGPMLGWYRVRGKVPVHSDHVIERHGLFTIILLGEAVVVISDNFQYLYTHPQGYLLILAYLIVIAFWWIYFDAGFGFATNLSKSGSNTFIFGYGQVLVFLSIALSAVALDQGLHTFFQDHITHINPYATWLLVSCGAFLVTISVIQLLISTRNPFPIYAFRLLVGISLIIVALAVKDLAMNQSVLIAIGGLVPVTVNDVYQWGKVSRVSE